MAIIEHELQRIGGLLADIIREVNADIERLKERIEECEKRISEQKRRA